MKLDFLTDLNSEIKRLLTEYGLPTPSPKQLRSQDKRTETEKNNIAHYDLKNLLIHFFSVHERLVPINKWNVHISSKLTSEPKIKDIVSKLSNGENINNLLSNRVRKTDQAKFADLLLSEWGIHHFHFQEHRSSELLFIFFTDADAYVIDILEHEKRDGSIVTWTNTDLIQTMHDNWPELMKQYVYKVESTTQALSIEERRALRSRSSFTTVVVDDGTEYFPMGGGFTSSRHSVLAVSKANYFIGEVERQQLNITQNKASVCEALLHLTSSPELTLKLDENLCPFIVEVKSNKLINFY
ncbi:hypothetical protein KIJ96_06305 [Pseudoalteromonas piscicida]|uniref:hypothetical protein n=1 Tax=Pseudoalteromonas piscicida TaxID=43662 RepID=UPI001D0A7C7D|nr:hypothetical protein [Pseudoalteromonas piscicida]UDM62848.1 hypothetical protein KIJ96_06305 [Pseudoalteromonas piscicida]